MTGFRHAAPTLVAAALFGCGIEVLRESPETDDSQMHEERASTGRQALSSVRPLVDEGLVVPREVWGSRPAGDCRAIETPNRVTVHHGGQSGGPITNTGV
jgi:hypothetical protein